MVIQNDFHFKLKQANPSNIIILNIKNNIVFLCINLSIMLADNTFSQFKINKLKFRFFALPYHNRKVFILTKINKETLRREKTQRKDKTKYG